MYRLNEPGMKKLMNMDATYDIISDVEENHKCIFDKSILPAAPGTSGSFTMNLPYHSMSLVNDKEVKLNSDRQRIIVTVGDLAQQKVYACICNVDFTEFEI